MRLIKIGDDYLNVAHIMRFKVTTDVAEAIQVWLSDRAGTPITYTVTDRNAAVEQIAAALGALEVN